MKLDNPQGSTIIFGFDSAWTDSPKAPGAICAIAFDASGQVDFREPQLVSFAQALEYIKEKRQDYAVSLVAIDQPTAVPNTSGSRPVDRVAGSLVSFVGGGVQPANRSRIGMFCDNAPIWRFVAAFDAPQSPLDARSASQGHFLIEVFPALALPALHADFAKRLGAPNYNPRNRRKFRIEDWQSVSRTVASTAMALGIHDLASWANGMASLPSPEKADQDRLDSALCVLIGLIWRGGPVDASVYIGDTVTGYMISPTSDSTRKRLQAAAERRGVSIV